jgi:hypothetical protein
MVQLLLMQFKFLNACRALNGHLHGAVLTVPDSCPRPNSKAIAAIRSRQRTAV